MRNKLIIIQDDANNSGVRLKAGTPVEFIDFTSGEGFPNQEMVLIEVNGEIIKFPAQSVGTAPEEEE